MQEQAFALQLFPIKKDGLPFFRKPIFAAGRIERSIFLKTPL
jgi:hypothetical protein